jgi:hypothetical protein
VARLSSSDLVKIPGYVLRPEDQEAIISPQSMPNVPFFGSDWLVGRSRRGVTAQNGWRFDTKFKSGCVITPALGNCVVDQIFHVCGLKDLQALCGYEEDPTGTKLLFSSPLLVSPIKRA